MSELANNYDFAKLAKAARREQFMRIKVYGKKVENMQMKPEEAEEMTGEMRQIAEILEKLTVWKQTRQHVDG